jgi:prephenate dehydrogenase
MTSPAEPSAGAGRALIIGVGLIGGSIALALRKSGWHVSGLDLDEARLERALAEGVLDESEDDPDATLVVVATPAGSVATTVQQVLRTHDDPDLLVTDVSGIKGPIVAAVDDPRFIGGHPMAGSEQTGLEGARADLFLGATWVLTPGPSTPPALYARLVSIVHLLGAQSLALPAADHDRLVAHVSHVPHLVAASLMNEASGAAEDDAALLQLAAGGFRDMTRIAAGHPGIWPDVVVENRQAILEALDSLADQVAVVRRALAEEDRQTIFELLERASQARQALPGRAGHPGQLAQVRIPVPDQAGVIAQVASTASDLGVSVVDVEIAHSVEGDRGVLIVVVAAESAERYAAALKVQGFSCTVQEL